MPYREKRIYSGPILEIDIYPITPIELKQTRKDKEKLTKPKQQNLNDKNAKKHLIRLTNANFDNNDLAVHLTYDQQHLPLDSEQGRRDIANFTRRVKAARKKKGLPELKYIAVIECRDPEESRAGVRIHHHIIMQGDMSREEVENLWGKGRCNADRLQADEYGFEGLARYIAKDPHGSKRWTQSKNLKQPEIHVNDHKYSKRKAELMANNPGDREQFERLYPGYTFTECRPEINEISGGLYLYIKMRQLDPRRKGNANGQSDKRNTSLQPARVQGDA